MVNAIVSENNAEVMICPDRRYCVDWQEECKIQASCLPEAKNDPESVFFVCMLSEITKKGHVDYDNSFYGFNKDLFIRSGGDEKQIGRILDDAVNSYYQRKALNTI